LLGSSWRLVVLPARAFIEDSVAEVGCEPGRLPGHPLGGWRVRGHAVDGPREIEGFLDRPDVLALGRRVDLRRITHGNPADRAVTPGLDYRILAWTDFPAGIIAE
jgi:hypothetical protein